MTIDRVLTIEGIPVEDWKETTEFDKLTALHPTERIMLENPKSKSITARAIDLIAPLGRGQRGLIVAAAAHRQDRPAQGHRALHPRQFARDRSSSSCSSMNAPRKSPTSSAA